MTVLKDNRFDHHNVTVRVYTEQPAKENLSGFAYDRSRGSLTEINNRWIRYENALLPEGDSARLKLYFPRGADGEGNRRALSLTLGTTVR